MLDYRDQTAPKSGALSSLTAGYAFSAYPYATHLFFLSWRSAFGEDISGRWNQMLFYHRFFNGMTIPSPEPEGDPLLYGIGDMWHTDNRFDQSILYGHLAANLHFYAEKHPRLAQEIYGLLATFPPSKRVFTHRHYQMLPYLLTQFRPEKIRTAAPPEDPLYYHAPTFGFLSMWSGRGQSDTYAAFRCGSRLAVHQHYDELSFVIYKHDFLALDAGSRTELDHHHNFGPQSVAHNTLLIHQEREPMPGFWKSASYRPDGHTYFNHGGQNSKSGTQLMELKNTADYLYAASDATHAYDAGKSREVIRQLVYLRPDIFIIYDRVTSRKPDQRKEFLLHTMNRPEPLGPNRWRADYRRGRLFIQTLLPLQSENRLVGGPGHEFFSSGRNWPLEEKAPDGKPHLLAGNWRLEVSAAHPTERTTHFLHVLQASDTATGTMIPAEFTPAGEEDRVEVNGWAWYFRRTGKIGLRVEKITNLETSGREKK